MDPDDSKSRRPPRAQATRRAGVGSALLAVIGVAACGVYEYPHEVSATDPSQDFGPSLAGAGAAGSFSIQPPAPLPMAGATPPPPPATPPPSAQPDAGVQPPPSMSVDAGMPPAAGMPAMEPPRSGVVIDLGGMQVAKEDAIAFIHIGHSNMAGRATGPDGSRAYFFDETDPHAWMYHQGMPPELAREPYTAGDDLSGLVGGPGTALVKQAAALAPDKYFISLGFGRTSAYCTQFLPNSLYYDTLMRNALAIKDRVTFAAIVVMLGITERHGTSADITGFSSCINELVTAIRSDIGRPDLPVLLCDYEQEASGLLSVDSSFARSIIPEIRKVPNVVSNSTLVPTDGLSMEDDHHFNFDGHKEWTRRVLQIMQDKGWFPWAKP